MFSQICSPPAVESGNQLLAALPRDDWQRLQPSLEQIELVQGRTLHEAGMPLQWAYFPSTAVVSLVMGMRDGGAAEVAVVGNEGMVGVCALMGAGAALSGSVVQTAGQGWRMPARTLAGFAAAQGAVMQPFLRYTQALFVQLAQTSACQRRHAVQQQLCRWLLLHLDRLRGNDLLVTHERIADLLGVRRESVTASALKLQRAGLIRYVRGHIVILDRKGLEAESCECYAVVKSAYDRLDGGVLPSLPAGVPRSTCGVHALPAAPPRPALRRQAFALAR